MIEPSTSDVGHHELQERISAAFAHRLAGVGGVGVKLFGEGVDRGDDLCGVTGRQGRDELGQAGEVTAPPANVDPFLTFFCRLIAEGVRVEGRYPYDAEAFEAWFAPIVDAADELEFAPFGTTSGDHDELAAATDADGPRRHGLQRRVGFIPADQLDALLTSGRSTVRHAYLEPAASADGVMGHRLAGVNRATRAVLTEATLAALTRFAASTGRADHTGGYIADLQV